jgi:hypothetical protein
LRKIKVSRFQGFKVSRFQGFKVSRFQGINYKPESIDQKQFFCHFKKPSSTVKRRKA